MVDEKQFTKHLTDYGRGLSQAWDSIDQMQLMRVVNLLVQTRETEGIVWVGGNGGSAAISNHLVCDMTKGTHKLHCKPLKTISLSSNTPILTALSNDISYCSSFWKQLEYYLNPELDIVMLISSSGNSENIVEAANYCNDSDIPLIGMCGFDGGKLKKLSDIAIHVDSNNYGVIEDTHQSIMHILSQYLANKT